jgi:hypothetical protein
MAQNKLVFVVGLWRSGTSLLHTMLNLHPQIALMFESEPFLLWPPRSPASLWPDDWPHKLDFLNQAISRHHLDVSQLPKNVTGREGTLRLFQSYAGAKGATVMGGKAPAYHGMLPAIRQLFPEASFIIIWRNPVACCRSAAEAGRTDDFFAQRGITTRILFGAEAMARGVEHLRAEGSPLHEVVYDELVRDPETELRRICQFLEIPFDPKMLNLEAADLSVLPVGCHHDGVRSGAISQTARQPPAGGGDPILPPKFQTRARSYAALWRLRYSHLAFVRALPADPAPAPPGKLTQYLDGARYYFWCQVDRLKYRILRNIPLAWWRHCRRSSAETGTLEGGPNPNIIPRLR